MMADPQDQTHESADAAREPSQSELAQSIIEALLEHTRVVSDLVAVMAQALDDDTQKALVQTHQWQAYLESRRQLETTRKEIERFVSLVAPPAKN